MGSLSFVLTSSIKQQLTIENIYIYTFIYSIVLFIYSLFFRTLTFQTCICICHFLTNVKIFFCVFLTIGAPAWQFCCMPGLIGFCSNSLSLISLIRFSISLTYSLLILPVFDVQHKTSARINTALLILHKNFGKEHAVNILVDLLILMETISEFFDMFWVTFNILHICFIPFSMQYFQSVNVNKAFFSGK